MNWRGPKQVNVFITQPATAKNSREKESVDLSYFDTKHELALSTAFTLVETEAHSVTHHRALSWRRPALYDWLESRWGLRWTGEQWM